MQLEDKYLSLEKQLLKLQYPEVPWNDISGMRNKLVHDYFGVDIGMVWFTVTNDLPKLQKQISEIISA